MCNCSDVRNEIPQMERAVAEPDPAEANSALSLNYIPGYLLINYVAHPPIVSNYPWLAKRPECNALNGHSDHRDTHTTATIYKAEW